MSLSQTIIQLSFTSFAVTSLPLVSVCIPIYNAEDFITESIEIIKSSGKPNRVNQL